MKPVCGILDVECWITLKGQLCICIDDRRIRILPGDGYGNYLLHKYRLRDDDFRSGHIIATFIENEFLL